MFGEKDYQQLKVVTQLARDLDLPTRIVGVPTVRETDGLALSSRNAYLSPSERDVAPTLHRVLKECAEKIAAGEPIAAVLDAGRSAIAGVGFRARLSRSAPRRDAGAGHARQRPGRSASWSRRGSARRG